MRKSFSKQLNALVPIAHHKDQNSNDLRYALLQKLEKASLPKSHLLIVYLENLLYLLAYANSTQENALVEKEIRRLTRFLKIVQKESPVWLQNTGMPYSSIITQFSHDHISWILHHTDCTIQIDSFAESKVSLHEILYMTLPATEKHIAATGMETDDLLAALKIPDKEKLPFIIREFSRLNDRPQVKDTLFDQLGMYVQVVLKKQSTSKPFNRLPVDQLFFHHELLTQFDHESLILTPIPKPIKLSAKKREQYIQVVKNTMMLTVRETDPTTYMQPASFRLYNLERGISIAIYGMDASRQLPLESYIGYTAFKNGLPVSYGGAWIFGERANFGINIFEAFRKGESGYIFAQLLRLYKNAFGISYFEVEPYQYGLDNPEGISSGAFWFYYKYGFRPVDKELFKKAELEAVKIKKKKGYRTNHKILIEFTESNICLKMGRKTPLSVPSVTSKITKMIHSIYKGNRAQAEGDCMAEFKRKTGLKRISKASMYALIDIALWVKAMNINDQKKLGLMAKMALTKSTDQYQYQALLLRLLSTHS